MVYSIIGADRGGIPVRIKRVLRYDDSRWWVLLEDSTEALIRLDVRYDMWVVDKPIQKTMKFEEPEENDDL